MSSWWKRRSLKLRLTLWYAAATAVVLAVFAWVAYEIVEHRLGAELDRQLRIDFDVIEAQLDRDTAGQIRWPVRDADIKRPMSAPLESSLRFYGIELEKDLHVRIMERPARVHDLGVIVRVF